MAFKVTKRITVIMVILTYTAWQLIELWKPAKHTTIPRQAYSTVKELGICRIRSTHRGTKANSTNSNTKPITVRTTNRPKSKLPKQLAHRPSYITRPDVTKWDLPAVMFTNICGGHVSKLDEILVLCKEANIGICGIAETWLTHRVPDECVAEDGRVAEYMVVYVAM